MSLTTWTEHKVFLINSWKSVLCNPILQQPRSLLTGLCLILCSLFHPTIKPQSGEKKKKIWRNSHANTLAGCPMCYGYLTTGSVPVHVSRAIVWNPTAFSQPHPPAFWCRDSKVAAPEVEDEELGGVGAAHPLLPVEPARTRLPRTYVCEHPRRRLNILYLSCVSHCELGTGNEHAW